MIKLSKKKKIVIIVLVSFAILIFGYFLSSKFNVIYGKIGETVTLNKGQEYKITGKDISVRIKDFGYNPCPEHAYCELPEYSVSFDIVVNGVKYTNFGGGYSVWNKSSDWKTYTKISVIEMESE